MDKIKCHLILHSKMGHLNQLYTGFIELEKNNLVDLTIENKVSTKEHILEVIVNNDKRVIYDTFDEGWRYSSEVDINDVDYYFKRSFDKNIHNNLSPKIKPLGLNYNVYSEFGNVFGKKEVLLNHIKKIVKKKGSDFYVKDFECNPSISETPKVCFLTRLWDPNGNEVENEDVRKERIEINNLRASCIRACKENYGDRFIGGVEDNEFSRKYYADCIVEDSSITNRSNFLNVVKSSDICIATTGLHKSIGWKFGEYIAASRAIITEPLYYDIPGDFKRGRNYLEFKTVEELISSIDELILDKEERLNIMRNNHEYYKNYVKPDKLVMNTLLQVLQEK